MVTVKINMAMTPLVKHTHFKSSHDLLILSFLLYPAPLCVLRNSFALTACVPQLHSGKDTKEAVGHPNRGVRAQS